MSATTNWTPGWIPKPTVGTSTSTGASNRARWARGRRLSATLGLFALGALWSSGCGHTAQNERGGTVPVDTTRDPRTMLDCPRGTAVTQGVTMGALSAVYCERPTGVRHGPYLDWWPNKIKKSVGNYKEGQRDGVWSFFTQTGELESQVNYQGSQAIPINPAPAAPAPPPAPVNPANPAVAPAPPP
jgi:hypothetical protein